MEQSKTGPAILIVDDDAGIRSTMQEFMENAGFDALKAASAEEALALLKERDVEVVITDIMLPGLGGLELTDIIKKDYDTDVIVMTGYSGHYCYEDAINTGASDFIIKPVRLEELLLRLKRVLRERKLSRERVQMMKKLQKLALTDGLTKLYNSRSFYSQLDLEIGRVNRYNHALSLLMIDIDNFKQYNDSYGHLEGDRVLVRFGEIIKNCLRTMDSAYRYGGEEFTVMLPETGGDEAVKVAERIRRTLESETFHPDPGKSVSVTISIGVAQYRDREKSTDFVRRADQAMYMSKGSGRNRVTSLAGGEEAPAAE